MKSKIHELQKNYFKGSKTKMKLMASLKIWLAIYPSITFFLFVFGKALNAFPIYQRTLILTLVLVPFVVFIGVPIVDYIMRQFGSRDNK